MSVVYTDPPPSAFSPRRISSPSALLLPWTWAILLFHPVDRYRYDDTTMWVWSRIRALLSAAVIVAITVQFDVSALTTLSEVAASNAVAAAIWGALVVVTVCPVIWLFVETRWKLTAGIALAKPGIRLAIFVAIIAGLFELNGLEYRNGRVSNVSAGGLVADGRSWPFLLWILASVWIGLFVIVAVYLIAAHQFAAADAHPALPPIVTLAVTWGAFLGYKIDGAERVRLGGILPLFPTEPRYGATEDLATVIGLVTLGVITVLAVLELIRMRRQLSLRRGPWR